MDWGVGTDVFNTALFLLLKPCEAESEEAKNAKVNANKECLILLVLFVLSEAIRLSPLAKRRIPKPNRLTKASRALPGGVLEVGQEVEQVGAERAERQVVAPGVAVTADDPGLGRRDRETRRDRAVAQLSGGVVRRFQVDIPAGHLESPSAVRVSRRMI